MYRAFAALLAIAALLALPGVALAQSAGDEQYVDPFQGGEEQPEQAPQEEPAEPVEPAPAAPPSDPGDVAAEPAQTEAPTLPRTGLPLALVASAGYALLLAGIALRRKL